MPFACSLDVSDEAVIVTIDTGLGNGGRSSSRGTAPENIASIIHSVTGRYMDEIQKDIPPETGITMLEVPAGKARTFEILATAAPGAGAVKSYKGSITLNLKPGKNISVPVQMDIFETKILIPDPLNSRIIQIDSMEGTSAEINASWKSSDFSGWTSFMPAAVLSTDRTWMESLTRSSFRMLTLTAFPGLRLIR